MSRKAFCIQVELDVQSVSCPGVWLCSNGKVALHIYMLDSCIQTASYKPLFPIKLNETYFFYKTFYPKHQLNELQRELHNEWIYMELVQWQSCEIGNVLASFQTTLDELLYPSTVGGALAGVDLDLLMEPTKNFPGTLAPKVEISTKTTIDETLCTCKKPSVSESAVVNPKVLTSQFKHQNFTKRKVCHSLGFSKKKRPVQLPKKPLFAYRKADDYLILRKPECASNTIKQHSVTTKPSQGTELSVRRTCPCMVKMCACGCGHRDESCTLCKKYRHCFEGKHETEFPCDSKVQAPRTSLFQRNPVQDRSSKYGCISRDLEVSRKSSCSCLGDKKSSLAEKLHEKFLRTLHSVPRLDELTCFDDEKWCRCNICETSKTESVCGGAEFYRDLQRMYGDLYQKARAISFTCPCGGE